MGQLESILDTYEFILEMAAETTPNCRDDQQLASWVYAFNLYPVFLDFNESMLTTTYWRYDKFHFDRHLGMLVRNETSRQDGVVTSTFFQPRVLHFNGGRDGFAPTVHKLFRWYLKRYGKRTVYKMLEEGEIYVDGVKQNFDKMCNITKLFHPSKKEN